MQGIYAIICLKNSKVYIGQSIHIEQRFEEHKYELNKGTHTNKHLQNAWNKYGEQNFMFSTLEECEEQVLTEREQYWIDFYGGINSKNTYNFRDASSRGKMSDETLMKMSEATKKLRQNPEWVEKNAQAIRDSWTPERRAQFSAKKKGVKLTAKQYEACLKSAELRRGISMSADTKNKISKTLLGHSMSEETKAKISTALKGRKRIKSYTDIARENIRQGAIKGWETRKRNGRVNIKGPLGSRWMNDGHIAKQVKSDEIDIYLSQGYIFGRKFKEEEL